MEDDDDDDYDDVAQTRVPNTYHLSLSSTEQYACVCVRIVASQHGGGCSRHCTTNTHICSSGDDDNEAIHARLERTVLIRAPKKCVYFD